MTDVERKASAWIASHYGKGIDVNGVYGWQSPDLVIEYARHMTGDAGWFYPGHAKDFRLDEDVWFDKVDTPEYGDVVVFPDEGSGYGTLGLYVSVGVGRTWVVFTQNPGPCDFHPIPPWYARVYRVRAEPKGTTP